MLRIEKSVDRAASALFAAACGYAAFVGFAHRLPQPSLAGASTVVASFAYMLCIRRLKSVQPSARKAPVPIFDVRDIDAFPPELLLTERHEPVGEADDALLLDDILAKIGPESRVVRLFDASAMPTPGQLNARIRDRLAASSYPPAAHDASQALHEALAELRQSLR